MTATPLRTLSCAEPPGSGLATRLHLAPFQCRMRVCSAVPLKKEPTAQALAADVALTPVRPALIPRLGLATWVHLVPFQCRMRVCEGPLWPPTAQALVEEMAATPRSAASPGLGLVTRVHLVPFQCRMRVCDGGGSKVSPTAQASFADRTRTPDSSLKNCGLGVAACFQTVPFQCRARVFMPWRLSS